MIRPKLLELSKLGETERLDIADSALQAIVDLHGSGITIGRFNAHELFFDKEGLFFHDIRKMNFLAKGESPVPEMMFVLAELSNSGILPEAEIGRYIERYLDNPALCEQAHEYFCHPHNYRKLEQGEYMSLYHGKYTPKKEAKRSHEELKSLIENGVKRYRTAVSLVNGKE